MKRHYYISDDLDDLEVIEQQLEPPAFQRLKSTCSVKMTQVFNNTTCIKWSLCLKKTS